MADEEYGVTIVEPLYEVEPTEIRNASPKRYITAALSAEFEVRAAKSVTLEKQAPFKSGDRAGQPRADRAQEHLWVLGRVKERARFKIYFIDNRFDVAWVWDAAGWPTELGYDYEVGALERKQWKDEPEWAWRERISRLNDDIRRREATYNDGEYWVNPGTRMVTTGEALDDWFADLVPDFTRRKKAVRKPKQSELDATELLAVGEWVG